MFNKGSWDKAESRTAVCLSELSCVMKKKWWIERQERLNKNALTPLFHSSTSRRKMTWSKDKKNSAICSFLLPREYLTILPSSFSYTLSQRIVHKNFALYLGNTVTSEDGLHGNLNRLREKPTSTPVSRLSFILI